MSQRKQKDCIKRNQKHKTSEITQEISGEYYKYSAPKKQLVNMPDMNVDGVEKGYIYEQDESTYEGASGKYVTVDQMRLKNINNMLNTLQHEFAMLNKDAEDGRNEYSVNSHYYTSHNNEILKTIDKLNE